jgi:hypothetical protein
MTTYRKAIAAEAGEVATVMRWQLAREPGEKSDSITGLQYLGESEEFEF